jgi:hypothetical protein
MKKLRIHNSKTHNMYVMCMHVCVCVCVSMHRRVLILVSEDRIDFHAMEVTISMTRAHFQKPPPPTWCF